MLAHVSDNPLHDLEQGMITLSSVEDMIANGRVDIKLRPWTVRARKQLQDAQQLFRDTVTDEEHEVQSEFGNVGTSSAAGEVPESQGSRTLASLFGLRLTCQKFNHLRLRGKADRSPLQPILRELLANSSGSANSNFMLVGASGFAVPSSRARLLLERRRF